MVMKRGRRKRKKGYGKNAPTETPPEKEYVCTDEEGGGMESLRRILRQAKASNNGRQTVFIPRSPCHYSIPFSS